MTVLFIYMRRSEKSLLDDVIVNTLAPWNLFPARQPIHNAGLKNTKHFEFEKKNLKKGWIVP